MRSPITFTVSTALAALVARVGIAMAQPALPTADIAEPRAFGYTVGDVVQRRVLLHLPAGTTLDTASLPALRRPGQAIELRNARLHGSELLLDYQVLRAPAEVRILELPPLVLRFSGTPQTVRIDAWPLTVAPLTPPDPSPRNGLGELRPDLPPPLIDTAARRLRLAVWAAALLLTAAGWAFLTFGRSRRRPFADAWRALRRLPATPTPGQRRDALCALHAALDRSAGRVLFEADVPGFVAARPAFGRSQAALLRFFQQSRAEFFLQSGADADITWLVKLARDLRDGERDGA